MATLVLATAGMALGGSLGGSVLGLSTAVIGRAVGAAVGQRIDQRLLGAGGTAVETGRVDRFRFTGASEGAGIPVVYGQFRVGGQVIWATEFVEDQVTSGGGKGTSSASKTTSYSYSVSLAIALSEGPIAGVGRIWADGEEIAADTLNLRVYRGDEAQMPDPRMEAVEGAGQVPAYRGVAYVVIEDLQLGQFGNRVPQFSFEVFRPAESQSETPAAVALIPGTGEYALATTALTVEETQGHFRSLNVNTASAETDFMASLTELQNELPKAQAASLVVSWFGNDLRVGDCHIKPMVEPYGADPAEMPWSVSGLTRNSAEAVPLDAEGRSIYGGTPCDASVIEAITEMTSRGIAPTFYPFVLMTQQEGNGLPDPWGGVEQAKLPWRGRITTAVAPGEVGTTDLTAAADAEVAAFFGGAQGSDFVTSDTGVSYIGAPDFGYRRFILHYAHLCAMAGGVEAFCIGSEMRSLTQIRGSSGFPAVEALRALAADVRAILGPQTKITYAADWSEYHGYQPVGTNDKIFHLDPLWADENIDLIGVDNYLPLSDWRDGQDHIDAVWGSVYNLDYLKANVAGGEMFDWYYHSDEARDAQIRTPITDGMGEPWIWRAKDFVSWWNNYHFDRVDGVRAQVPTAWEPTSKPIWFTEFGCAAIDKGTNQPNKFLDAKSSESALPHYSNGRRDDFLQARYIQAVLAHFGQWQNNPQSAVYGGPMLDIDRCFVWCWDARPFPQFPGLPDVWSDAENYRRGHWLNGRGSAVMLPELVKEICARSGMDDVDVTALNGLVRGYRRGEVETARSSLQDLALAYGFDACERDGTLMFISRGIEQPVAVAAETLAVWDDNLRGIERRIEPGIQAPSQVSLSYIEQSADYDVRGVSAQAANGAPSVSRTQMDLLLTDNEAQQIVDRWLNEASIAEQSVALNLPPSREVSVGQLIEIDGATYRVDQATLDQGQQIQATRVVSDVYDPVEAAADILTIRNFTAPSPVSGCFLDLPIVSGTDDVPNVRFAASGVPWPGSVAVYRSLQDANYALDFTENTPAVMGTLQSDLMVGQAGRWQRGDGVVVKVIRGIMTGATSEATLAGANTIGIGTGEDDTWEIVQFQSAELIDTDTYHLTGLLRGLAGGAPAASWPAGSKAVLIDDTVPKVSIGADQIGLMQYLRYGPADRAIGDSRYRAVTRAFDGLYQRPLSVCHLSADPQQTGTSINWIRRGRLDSDRWTGVDIPLGEETESYQVTIWAAGQAVRTVLTDTPSYLYPNAQQDADGAGIGYDVEVRQVSRSYGPGAAAVLAVAAP